MNFILAGITTSVALSTISAVTAASNGMYTLIGNVVKSTSTGATEIKLLIQRNDLEMRIRMIQFILSELYIDDDSPYSLRYCISKIYDAIKDISDELSKIHYRMQYNDNLWFGSSVRAYGFRNCQTRLEAKIETLEKRYQKLMEVLSIHGFMKKNNELENVLSESIINYSLVNNDSSKKIRDDLHKNLEFIK